MHENSAETAEGLIFIRKHNIDAIVVSVIKYSCYENIICFITEASVIGADTSIHRIVGASH